MNDKGIKKGFLQSEMNINILYLTYFLYFLKDTQEYLPVHLTLIFFGCRFSFYVQNSVNLFSDDKVNLYLSRVLSRPRSDNSLMIF